MKIMGYISGEYVGSFFPARARDSHKGDYGRILIAAGSHGMAGACAFAAKSALRTGSGLVMILTPEGNIPVVQTLVPEAVCMESEDAFNKLARFDGAAAGSGMGKSSGAAKALAEVLRGCPAPLVLDADGLNLLAENREVKDAFDIRKRAGRETVITPHMGEAARLLGGGNLNMTPRTEICRMLYEEYGAVTVLKGHETCVAMGDEIWLNPTGNPGMATAGSGDSLTGIIASLMGQGHDPFSASIAAVYVHGLAGDLAAEEKGEYSLIVSDLIEKLPEAIIRVSSCR